MRIVLVALDTPFNRSAWSGVPFHALRELKRRFHDLHVIDTPILDRFIRLLLPLTRIGLLVSRETLVTSLFEKLIARRIRELRPDIIVSIGAGHKISRIDPSLPVIHVADGLFLTIVGYYPRYRHLSQRSRRLGARVQRDVVDRSSKLAMASDWAATAAAADYPDAAARIHVVPMGANVDEDPPVTLPRANTGPLKLLFVGYDWQRKGGDMVLAVFSALRATTGTAELHIVGCKPRETRGVAGVSHHGVLRKSNPSESSQLSVLFRECHFLIMPSREEAFGLVYCEACAFGLPSIATRTGGVATYVGGHGHGLLFSMDAPVAEYVAGILELWRDGPRYRAMQQSARQDFEARLNWQAWGSAIETLVRSTLADRQARSDIPPMEGEDRAFRLLRSGPVSSPVPRRSNEG